MSRLRIGVTAQPEDERRIRILKMVLDVLHQKADVVLATDVARRLGSPLPHAPLDKMDVDVLCVIGGDGSILYALQHTNAPVFSVNAGEIGFLTEIEPIEIHDGFDRLLAGDYFLEERAKLSVHVNRERLTDVVNEAVLRSPRASKLMDVEVRHGETLHMRVRADGVIVATPTGSTSYAMSAGGPIMDPRVAAILVVPIAAFSLTSRPLVFPADANLELTIPEHERPALLVFDGQAEREVGPGDVIRISTSEHAARFVRFRQHFYARLQERLQ